MVIRSHYLKQIVPFVGTDVIKEKEVDFVCQRDGDRTYVQVTYMMSDKSVRDREFGALESVPDQYGKIVLSMDCVDFSRNGIRHMYLPDFMNET